MSGVATELPRSYKGNWAGDVRLYRLDPPMETYDGTKADHVIVSAVEVLGVSETYIFAARETGEVVNWGELAGSFRGALDHAGALRGAGYEIGGGE
jgi:hypothetical protein